MKRFFKIFVGFISISVLLIGCKGSSSGASETEIRTFLVSKEGTYGRNTAADNIGLDFFQDIS